MNEVEGIGTVVTGGLVARAIEPKAGEAASGEGQCLNCGTELIGPHCHQCGQIGNVHRTLGAFGHDLLHSVLHFEGKVWRTLPMLAWRPGELARRYIHGERARFVSPMALFLFSVFLMFAVFSTIGGPIGGDRDGVDTGANDRAEARREFEQERAETLAELTRLRAERARLVAALQPTRDIDIEIATTQSELAVERRIFEQAMRLAGEEEMREAEAKADEATRKAGPVRQAAEKADEEKIVLVTGADPLNDWFNDAYRRAKENPSLLIYKLETNAYKFSWMLVPISVPFVWLLFLHRKRYRQYKAYDHTVFVTYSISFMTLAVIALSLLRPLGLGAGAVAIAMMFLPPVHIFRQLRGAYQLSWWSALWRTFVLINFAFVAASLFFMLLLALGVLG